MNKKNKSKEGQEMPVYKLWKLMKHLQWIMIFAVDSV